MDRMDRIQDAAATSGLSDVRKGFGEAFALVVMEMGSTRSLPRYTCSTMRRSIHLLEKLVAASCLMSPMVFAAIMSMSGLMIFGLVLYSRERAVDSLEQQFRSLVVHELLWRLQLFGALWLGLAFAVAARAAGSSRWRWPLIGGTIYVVMVNLIVL